MILPLAPLYENARVIPLFAKEGSGVVDREAGAKIRHPLPPPQSRRGTTFMAEWRLEYGPLRTAKGEQTQKDVKINGTNYVKSFRINKNAKKRTQNELVFERKNGQKNSKTGQKSTFLLRQASKEEVTLGQWQAGSADPVFKACRIWPDEPHLVMQVRAPSTNRHEGGKKSNFNERTGNVYENKGPTLEGLAQSRNLYENTGT
jgi:hypothetical protein